MNLSYLNEKQKEAVLYNDGPLMILAGAGSGKTRVITSKIYYLIEECKVDPYNILAITFTNKAAAEMRNRTNSMLRERNNNLIISTFHSLGLKILLIHYDKLGYKNNFIIMDSDDSTSLIKKILKDKSLDPKLYPVGEILKKISSYKNSQGEKYVLDDFMLPIYLEYEKRLKDNNAVDFDDLILLPVKLFTEFPEVLEYYQNRFKYILIDEFQDINNIQYELSYMLARKNKKITCVGDIDQSIYSFRDANYENIFMFERDFKDLLIIKLEQNYRSTGNILNASNSLIRHNKKRKEKNLWTKNEDGEKLYCFRAFDERGEAEFILKEIKRLQELDVFNNEIAVLYRNNVLSRNIEQVLKINRIPYKIIGGVGFYARSEIKNILAYLRFIYNESDTVSLTRIINFPKRGIGERTVSKLSEKAQLENITMYEAIESGKEGEFKSLIEELKLSFKDMTVLDMFEELLAKTKIRETYEQSEDIRDHNRIEFIEEFRSVIKENANDKKGIEALGEFLLETSLISDTAEEDGKDQINLMTIHSSKGTEFDYVFIIGLEDTILPSIKEDSDFEEERRLLYVAITRARKKVFLLTTIRRLLYGQSVMRGPSSFISEIDREYMELSYKEELQKVDIDEMYVEREIIYEIGDNVHHKIFGRGKVVRVDDSNLIEVQFYAKNDKKLINKQHRDLIKY